jgi:hypothetical protein
LYEEMRARDARGPYSAYRRLAAVSTWYDMTGSFRGQITTFLAAAWQ